MTFERELVEPATEHLAIAIAALFEEGVDIAASRPTPHQADHLLRLGEDVSVLANAVIVLVRRMKAL